MKTNFVILFAMIALAGSVAYAEEAEGSFVDLQGDEPLTITASLQYEGRGSSGRSLLGCYYWYDRCDSQRCVCAQVNNNNNNNNNNNGRKMLVVVVATGPNNGWWDSSENRCVCVQVDNNNNNNNNGK